MTPLRSVRLAALLLVLIAVCLLSSATPVAAQEDCYEGTADLCASTCGEDMEGVEITEVCATYNGQTSCECCCYYQYLN